MTTAYVVRELVSVASGERDFLTHYEFGTFSTYEAANRCAIETRNPRCFPQQDSFLSENNFTAQNCQEMLP
jgi:hypothetical protein